MSREVFPRKIEVGYDVDLPSSGAGAPGGRNFFVCLDGTWNEERSQDGTGAPSNVRKLYDCLGPDSEYQISRYFRGVGNRQDNWWWKRKWYGLTGGEERRIREAALARINREYRAGDNLFIIGFSRGAACARRLAADLAARGISKRVRIVSRYLQNRITRQAETRMLCFEPEGEMLKPVSVSYLGCWDTVGAFVVPVRFPNSPGLDWLVGKWNSFRQRCKGDVPFANLTVAPSVIRAVHCVAIDESRNAFLPTLMNRDDRVEEVWFPGVHADVGGGYQRDGLSRLSLKFMIDRINQHVQTQNLRAIHWNDDILAECARTDDDCDYDFHFHGLTHGFSLYGKSIRRMRVQDIDQPGERTLPKVSRSVSMLWQSERVYACDPKTDRHWRTEYRPFNVSELRSRLGDADGGSRGFQWSDDDFQA